MKTLFLKIFRSKNPEYSIDMTLNMKINFQILEISHKPAVIRLISKFYLRKLLINKRIFCKKNFLDFKNPEFRFKLILLTTLNFNSPFKDLNNQYKI